MERKDKPGTVGLIPFLILGERVCVKEIGWGGNNGTAVTPKELWVSCRSCFKQLSVASFEPLIFDLINSFEVYVGNAMYKVCLHVFLLPFMSSFLHLSFSGRKDTLVLYSVSRWVEIWLSNLPGPLESTVGPIFFIIDLVETAVQTPYLKYQHNYLVCRSRWYNTVSSLHPLYLVMIHVSPKLPTRCFLCMKDYNKPVLPSMMFLQLLKFFLPEVMIVCQNV